MSITLGRATPRETFAIDLDRLPATAQRDGGKALGVIIMIFAAVWGGFPVVGAATMSR